MRVLLDHLGGSSVISFAFLAASKAAVLLMIAGVLGQALRRRSAAARHLVWTTALLGALAVPVVTRIGPSWPLAVSVPPTLVKAAEATPTTVMSRSELIRSSLMNAAPDRQIQDSAPVRSVAAAPGDRWSPLIFVWVAGAVVSVLPLVVGLLNLALIARRTAPIVDPEWNELVRTLSNRLRLRRRVRLVKSSGSTMPITWGWLRPVVLLPGDSDHWPQERRYVVLLHELAHVKRLDCLTQQLAQLSCALYWFNPLSWWASKQMMVERERACDDLVLLSGSRPSEYARHLLALAREQRGKRGLSMAGVAMARRANLEGRLRAILDPQATPRRLSRWAAASGLLASGAVVVSLSGLRLEAQTAKVNGSPPSSEAGRSVVQGRVLDAEEKPVAGARVVVLARLFRRLTNSYEDTIVKGQGSADDQGRFRIDFPRVPDGDKTLVVTAPGHGAGFEDVTGSDEEEHTIRLGPEQVVRGRFIDRQGSPAANVGFYLSDLWRRKPNPAGFPVTTPLNLQLPLWLGSLRTDAQGRFILRELPVDAELTFEIRDDRFALQDVRITSGHEEKAEEIVLSLDPGHLLEGRVSFGDTGQPVAGARLHVVGYKSPTTTQSFDRIDGQTDTEGRFRISASVAHHYDIVVEPPDGSPYFLRRLTPTATEEPRQQVDATLERGILVRGLVHDTNTGQPVAGAIVVYRPKRKNNPMFKEDLFDVGGYRELSVLSDANGFFRIPASPGLGHLLVKGPNSDFIPVRTSEGELEYDVPDGARLYPVGLLPLSLDASATVADVSIPLRRGATIEGRVVGPDGTTVPSGDIYSEAVDPVGFGFDFSGHPIEKGRFSLRGLDPEKTIFAFFFDAKHQLGASLTLSVPKDGRPVTVTLLPCGSARVRFVDQAGKPLANVANLDRPRFGLEMVIRLDASGNPRDGAAGFDTTLVDNIDHDRYESLSTNGQGQLTFPSLIPGATYRVMAAERGWVMKKEFIAVAGKTLDLSEISIIPPG